MGRKMILIDGSILVMICGRLICADLSYSSEDKIEIIRFWSEVGNGSNDK